MNTVASAPASGDGTLDEDPRWELVQRIAASSTLEKSKRLQGFLLFVGERALRDPGRPVSEHEIRREVFGRSTDVDAMEDTVVRVQASHLRRRLEQYFAIEGAAETLVIEVPRGSYTPVFHERTVAVAAVPVLATAGRRPAWPLAALAVLLAAACVVLALDAHRWRTRAANSSPPPSLVQASTGSGGRCSATRRCTWSSPTRT